MALPAPSTTVLLQSPWTEVAQNASSAPIRLSLHFVFISEAQVFSISATTLAGIGT
jgi:hypothetical protein